MGWTILLKEYENDFELLYLVSENNEEANEKIYDKYKPAIDYYAKKYLHLIEGKGLDYNDLFQEGLIGLDSAIKKYKEQKDIKFSTFAFICIRRRMISSVRNASRKKHSILNESYSIDYHNEDDDKNGFENIVYSNLGGIEDLLVSRENSINFNKRIKKTLTPLENEVYELKINGFTHEEICESLGKSFKSIEGVLYRIRVKIREILKEINWLF